MDRLRIQGERGFIFDGGKVAGYGNEHFKVAVIPRVEAVRLIRANHYSGSVVNNSYLHLGVFYAGALAGALQWGYAMNPASGRSVVTGTGNTEYLELNRMWISDLVPPNGESLAISYALKVIRRLLPAVRWVQSFADERCGGAGIVYQAANFLYCGCHRSRFYRLDGVWYHNILATTRTRKGVRGAHLQANLHRAEAHDFRQFRYLFFLDPCARADLRLPVLPYPKPMALAEAA